MKTPRGFAPLIVAAGLMTLLAACSEREDLSQPGPSGSGPDGGTRPDAQVTTPQADLRSRAPNLKKKTGEQLTLDLAQALELDRNEVCRELGLYDCASVAHRISLGGVEPYRLRIDRPLSGVGVNAPLAVDRVALSACGVRARADFSSASPVLFGALVAGESDGREQALDALYDRLLGRAPDPEERELLLSNWAGEPLSDVDFATLACFVVATSLEHLFY